MKRINTILLCVIIILLLINISFTATVINRQRAEATSASVPVSTANNKVNSDVAREWGDKVARLYNSQDHQSLYRLFNEQARVKISGEQLASQLQKLQALFGTIEDQAFLNAVKLGEKGRQQYYQLFYSARVSGKQNPATMKLSVVVEGEGDTVTLYGLRISASESLD